MTISDKAYKELSDQVYRIDPNHEKYDPTLKKGAIRNYGGRDFKILRTEDNQSNGMQAMAVAPVDRYGNPDYSQVVVSYAGTNAADFNDLSTDVFTVAYGVAGLGGTEVVVGKDGTAVLDENGHTIPAQTVTALKFAEEIKNKYPQADISTTGHSLGEYLALFSAAENKWKNVGFNGADPSDILSDEALQWVADNPGMLTNYRNRYDLINLSKDGTNAEVLIDGGFGELSAGDAHKLENWQFDENGKLIIPDSLFNQTALGQQMSREVLTPYITDLLKLSDLEVLFKTHGGGISSTEKIYLEDRKALAVVEAAARNFTEKMTIIEKEINDGIEQVKKNWQNGITDLKSIGEDLSEAEIFSLAAAKGYSRQKMVADVETMYQLKLDDIAKQKKSFETLANDIKKSIHETVKLDQEMATQIKLLKL